MVMRPFPFQTWMLSQGPLSKKIRAANHWREGALKECLGPRSGKGRYAKLAIGRVPRGPACNCPSSRGKMPPSPAQRAVNRQLEKKIKKCDACSGLKTGWSKCSLLFVASLLALPLDELAVPDHTFEARCCLRLRLFLQSPMLICFVKWQTFPDVSKWGDGFRLLGSGALVPAPEQCPGVT